MLTIPDNIVTGFEHLYMRYIYACEHVIDGRSTKTKRKTNSRIRCERVGTDTNTRVCSVFFFSFNIRLVQNARRSEKGRSTCNFFRKGGNDALRYYYRYNIEL